MIATHNIAFSILYLFILNRVNYMVYKINNRLLQNSLQAYITIFVVPDLEPFGGLEPPTYALRMRCSTN